MPRTEPLLCLKAEHRRELSTILVNTDMLEHQKRRAQILLALDQGFKGTEIERRFKVSKTTVYTIAKRYRERGIKGAVYDCRRVGVPSVIPPEAHDWIRSIAKISPELLGVKGPRWTITKLQAYIRTNGASSGYPMLDSLSRSYLWQILHTHRQTEPVL